MAKTDDVLLALSRTIPEYIQEVGVFQYKGKTCRLVDNFASSQYMKCGVCGNYPIFDVSVIRSEDGDRLNACNSCVDQITNQNVSGWFKNYRKKRENIIENRKYIDGLSSILAAYERSELPFQIPSEDVEEVSNFGAFDEAAHAVLAVKIILSRQEIRGKLSFRRV